MEVKPINQRTINTVLSILCALLIILGIFLIIRSDIIYQDSVILTNTVLDKTAYKLNSGQAPNYTGIRDSYGQALIYFTLAIGCIVVMLLLPRIQSFNIGPGGINVTLQALAQSVNAVVAQGNSLASGSAGAGGIPSPLTATDIPAVHKFKELALKLSGTDDPQKGKWGSSAEAHLRKLSATVAPSSIPGFFEVKAQVESVNPDLPLKGVVKYHLHPSFDNPDPQITAMNGVAVLVLKKVLGPFTLGAEADNGETRLELDLATLKGLPAGF
jgi:hypothetical protein